MADYVKGCSPPPANKKIWVVRIKTREPQQFVVLGEKCHGKWTHFVYGRTVGCNRERGPCSECDRGTEARWKGYLHCVEPDGRTECFVEFTPTAWEAFAGQVRQREVLRGIQFRIGRTSGGPRGRFRVELLERTLESSKLPVEREPESVLQFLWNYKNKASIPFEKQVG